MFNGVAFGDMFCNGIADYRRSYIEKAGWSCIFPLLGEDSTQLANEIIDDWTPHHDHEDHHHHHHDRYQPKSHDYKPLSFTKAPRKYRGLNFSFFDDYL